MVGANSADALSIFSIVNRSPRRCKAFPPTATTIRFFLGEVVAGGVMVVVVAVEAALDPVALENMRWVEPVRMRNCRCMLNTVVVLLDLRTPLSLEIQNNKKWSDANEKLLEK
jgi:hypothetical protein